jgi:seryl-tRNA synthetase
MALHLAVLRYAVDFMVYKHGFSPMSVPTLVREEAMVGTGFFPGGREQAYLIDESHRAGGGLRPLPHRHRRGRPHGRPHGRDPRR